MVNLYVKISRDLKRKCVDYALDYLMEDFYVSHFGRLFLEDQIRAKNGGISVGENKNFDNYFIARMDNFILFGKTMDDEKVLDVISKKG